MQIGFNADMLRCYIIWVNFPFPNSMTLVFPQPSSYKAFKPEPKHFCLLAWSLIFIGHNHVSPSCPSFVTNGISAQKSHVVSIYLYSVIVGVNRVIRCD